MAANNSTASGANAAREYVVMNPPVSIAGWARLAPPASGLLRARSSVQIVHVLNHTCNALSNLLISPQTKSALVNEGSPGGKHPCQC